MSQFSISGPEAVASGYSAISKIGKQFQEDQLVPDEMKAAKALYQYKAQEATSAMKQMEAMSRANTAAADAIREANAFGNEQKTLELRAKAYDEEGQIEAAQQMRDKLRQTKVDESKVVGEAFKAQEAKNEIQATTIRQITDYNSAKQVSQSFLDAARADVERDPTPENRMKYANIEAIQRQILEDERNEVPFEELKKNRLDPAADALSTTAQQIKMMKIEAENQRSREKNENNWQMALLRAQLEGQKIAASRNNDTTSSQLALGLATTKLDSKFENERSKLEQKRDALPETIPNPNEHFWNNEPDEIPNPEYVKYNALIEKLQARHDENLQGLAEAIKANKVFVPKPYNNIKPTTDTETTFTPEQENWIKRAMELNPGMSKEDIIAQGKKTKKL